MYAVIRTGGKQYRVQPGDELNLEKIAGDPGDTVELDQVLLVDSGSEVKIGQPLVDGASVKLEIVEQAKDAKIIVFKKQRRKGKQLKQGHRQMITKVRVADISAN